MSLVFALLLDATLGEPRMLWDRVPHPAVLMGKLVSWLESHLNRGPRRKAAGLAAMFVMAVIALGFGFVLSRFGPVVETLVAAALFAQRSLADHVGAVADALRLSLGEGRRAVARIVGRDTATMSEADVTRAAIESAAENFSDGVVAPVFWFALAGLPGLLLYKMTNTADSMIGYRTPRHAEFGWAAARFDDLLNLAPARLSALTLLAGDGALGRWRELGADARRHASPNAGWPEAAMARITGVALAGPRSYHGQLRDAPFVYPEGRRDPDATDIDIARNALWRGWAILLCFALMLWALGLS